MVVNFTEKHDKNLKTDNTTHTHTPPRIYAVVAAAVAAAVVVSVGVVIEVYLLLIRRFIVHGFPRLVVLYNNNNYYLYEL